MKDKTGTTDWRFYMPLIFLCLILLYGFMNGIPEQSLYDNALIKCLGNCSIR